MSSEAPQRESASRPHLDSSTGWTGASVDGAGEHGTRAGSRSAGDNKCLLQGTSPLAEFGSDWQSCCELLRIYVSVCPLSYATLCTTLAALLELARWNILAGNESLKLETDILKRTGDLAGEHVLSGYGTKRNEREQECVFNKHLTAGVFTPANVAKKGFFGHVSLSIKEGIYSGEEHFRAIANMTLSKPRR